MSLITRFNGAFKAFASEATGTFRTVFGGTTQSNDLTDNLTNDFKTGWEIVGTNDEPTIEDFNAMGYTLSQVLAYIHQVGIIEWSGTDGVVGGQDYYANKSYVGYGGYIYVAILDSGGTVEARVPTNATYWKKVSSSTLDINGQTNKPTPTDTDNFLIQEVAGTFKKLSWANLKATIISSFGAMINTLTSKATPVDADVFIIGDSVSTFVSKKLTFANLKASLLTYFDTLYSRTTAIFGIGQTWQDVTASRVSGTTYTNSTGKAIFVVVESTTGGGGAQLTPAVSGIFLPAMGGASVSKAFISFIVQSGAAYSVTANLGTMTKWCELR